MGAIDISNMTSEQIAELRKKIQDDYNRSRTRKARFMQTIEQMSDDEFEDFISDLEEADIFRL